MKAVAVTREQGGEWIEFKSPPDRDWAGVGGNVHSIKFDNGLVWDTVNGWRKNAKAAA